MKPIKKVSQVYNFIEKENKWYIQKKETGIFYKLTFYSYERAYEYAYDMLKCSYKDKKTEFKIKQQLQIINRG